MSDKYDEEIDLLMSIPADDFKSVLMDHWLEAEPLFQYVPRGQLAGSMCKCITAIRDEGTGCPSKRVLDEILKSELLVSNHQLITQDRAVLNEFARIQRMADKDPDCTANTCGIFPEDEEDEDTEEENDEPVAEEPMKPVAPQAIPKPLTLAPRTAKVYETLSAAETRSIDEIASKSGLPVHQVKAELMVLDCKKLIVQHPEKTYSIKTRDVPSMGDLPPAGRLKV